MSSTDGSVRWPDCAVVGLCHRPKMEASGNVYIRSALCQTHIWARCFWTGCDDCFDQLLFSSNRCGRVLFRPAHTEEQFNTRCAQFVWARRQESMCVVWRVHAHFSPHREAQHSCKGQNQKLGVMDTGRWLQLWTWTGNEESCAEKGMPFFYIDLESCSGKSHLFPLPVKLAADSLELRRPQWSLHTVTLK